MRLQRQKPPLRRMFIYLGVLAGVYGLGCYRLADNYLSPGRSRVAKPREFSDVEVPTAKGLTPAWITPDFAQRETLFVFAHGYGGDRDTWTLTMQQLNARGYACLAPAMPGQDASPDNTVGFGTKEAQVLVDSVRWAREQFGQKKPKIVLVGLSMGGAAAWLASELEPSVDGVVTEGAYADFNSTISRFFDRRLPGSSVYLRPVVWIAQARSGINPISIRPELAAEKWKGRPALVIQGEHDQLIDLDHAERLVTASGADLWIVPSATHAECQHVASTEYVERLVAFASRL